MVEQVRNPHFLEFMQTPHWFERRDIDWLLNHFMKREAYRAWSLFRIPGVPELETSEVDTMILTEFELVLVEIKSAKSPGATVEWKYPDLVASFRDSSRPHTWKNALGNVRRKANTMRERLKETIEQLR